MPSSIAFLPRPMRIHAHCYSSQATTASAIASAPRNGGKYLCDANSSAYHKCEGFEDHVAQFFDK